jgi:hypothetical protein
MAMLQSVPRPPTLAPLSEAEAIWASGRAGELRVQERLSRLLGDEWVAVAGYLNRGGEIDLLLVGPTGVMGVEVKTINGVVHCNGQQWVRDRFDRYGNLVERGVPIRDRKGRAPNRQINEAADALQAFMASRGQEVKILRTVVLAHDASRVGTVIAPGVDFIGAINDAEFDSRLLALVGKGATSTGLTLNVDKLVTLVQRDHDFNARRREGRGATEVKDAAASVQQSTPQPLELPRVVVLPSHSADEDAQGMPALMQRHSIALRQDVRALHGSRGTDRAVLQRVRRAVSGHLMSGARWSVLSAAVGELGRGPEAQLLERMIQECGERFEFEDRTLCTVVAPVAVRLRGVRHAGQGVCSGDAGQFDLPSIKIAQAIDASKVRFGATLYDGQTLLGADPSVLRDRLLQIEAGDEQDQPTQKPHWVLAEPEPEWQVVYFLGVAVMGPGEDADLDAGWFQQALMSSRRLGACAFTGLPALAFNRDIAAEAVCEGFWSLHEGVRKGDQLLRLYSLARALERAGGPAQIGGMWYVHVPHESCVRLLIRGATGAQEFRWNLMAGGSVDGFRHALDSALEAWTPVPHTAEPQEIELLAYEAMVRSAGLSWVSRA